MRSSDSGGQIRPHFSKWTWEAGRTLSRLSFQDPDNCETGSGVGSCMREGVLKKEITSCRGNTKSFSDSLERHRGAAVPCVGEAERTGCLVGMNKWPLLPSPPTSQKRQGPHRSPPHFRKVRLCVRTGPGACYVSLSSNHPSRWLSMPLFTCGETEAQSSLVTYPWWQIPSTAAPGKKEMVPTGATPGTG